MERSIFERGPCHTEAHQGDSFSTEQGGWQVSRGESSVEERVSRDKIKESDQPAVIGNQKRDRRLYVRRSDLDSTILTAF